MTTPKEIKTVPPPAAPTHPPLTCAALGEEAEPRAEAAVQQLHTLTSTSASTETHGPSILPTKVRILQAVASLDGKVKRKQEGLHKCREEMDKARQLEKEARQQELERQAQERARLELEQQEALQAKLVQRQEARAARRAKMASEEAEKRQVETSHEERFQEEMHLSLKEAVQELQRERRTDLETQVAEATARFDEDIEKARRDLEQEVEAAKAQVEAARIQRQQEKEKAPPTKEAMTHTPDLLVEKRHPGVGDMISSIYADNQRRAAEAHEESLSFIPYTSPEGRMAAAAQGGIPTYSVRTNEEWSNMAREVTGLADALYTEPSENPNFDKHMQHHAVIEPLVKEFVRDKNRKLKERWAELAEEYVVRTQVYSQAEHIHTKEKASEHKSVGGAGRQSIFGTKPSPSSSGSAISGGRSTNNPYRRARRGTTGGGGSGLGGSDVVRSEYEQEQIIAELTAKEAMEKRIKHGGSKLPRQICQLEKKLSANYIRTFSSHYVEDPLAEAEKHRITSVWTDMEKCIFLDRFLQHPKDFRKIASFLRNKTTRQCVQFYYDSKQSVPYKAALKEHLMRRKRKGDYATWDASIQAALSVGAVIRAGPNEEKPLIFSLPDSDCSYSTRHFHPMSREVFDAIDVSKLEVTEEALTSKKSKKRKKDQHTLFTLDKEQRKFLKSTTQDSLSSAKDQSSASELKRTASNISESLDVDKVMDASPARKVPQKWTAAEKRLFHETVEKHGKNWNKILATIGTKTLSQIKNYYYDHKKQFAKNRSGAKSDDDAPTGSGGVTSAAEDQPQTDGADSFAIDNNGGVDLSGIGLSSGDEGRRSVLSSAGIMSADEMMIDQGSLHGSHAMTSAADLWNQTQQALLTQQHLAAQLSSQEAHRLLQNQNQQQQQQQQQLANISNLFPWLNAAQVTAAQQVAAHQQHHHQQQAQQLQQQAAQQLAQAQAQQEGNALGVTHASVRDYLDATTQMQNALALRQAGHHGFSIDPSSHLRTLAMSNLAAGINPASLLGANAQALAQQLENSGSNQALQHHSTSTTEQQLQNLGLGGMLGYSTGGSQSAQSTVAAAAAALGLANYLGGENEPGDANNQGNMMDRNNQHPGY